MSRVIERLLRRQGMVAGIGLLVLALLVGSQLPGPARAEAEPGVLRPMEVDPKPVELAPFMGELQRLTHKMSLAIEASNAPLAAFYAYECVESLRTIQEEVPEYDGQPIALLVDRFGLPPYEQLNKVLNESRERFDGKAVRAGLENVIQNCNACHVATLHGGIKITAGNGINPFNQDFAP